MPRAAWASRNLLRFSAPWLLVLCCGMPLQAQMSPNCERNGRRIACAYTPWPTSSSAAREAGRVVFADHTIVEVQRESSSCRDHGNTRRCKAWILSPPSTERPDAAVYLGTASEGSYRHRYSSSRLQITYWVFD